MDTLLCVLFTVNLAVIKIIVELGEFILQEPILPTMGKGTGDGRHMLGGHSCY